MEYHKTKFEEIKKEAEIEYKKTTSVLCPFLKQTINFNTKGLDHIKFKDWNKTRLVSDQYLRLKLLKLAPLILSKSHTLQEYKETKKFERIRKNARWEEIVVPVKYYGFVAIVNYTVKIKVVVKEVNGLQPFFWSIIPFWRSKKDPITETTKKVFHEGDLEIE